MRDNHNMKTLLLFYVCLRYLPFDTKILPHMRHARKQGKEQLQTKSQYTLLH